MCRNQIYLGKEWTKKSWMSSEKRTQWRHDFMHFDERVTNGPMDQPKGRWTDKHSYREVRMHQKIVVQCGLVWVVPICLLHSNWVPIVTYASEIRSHSSQEMLNMDIALNDCIRKIFTFNRWESTRFLRRSFGYDSITEIFAKRKISFNNALCNTNNLILRHLLSVQS